jgi:hypothetical protein
MIGTYIADNFPFSETEQSGPFVIEYLAASAAPEPRELLNRAVRDVTKQGKTIPRNFSPIFTKAKNWGLAVLKLMFFDLRKRICGSKKEPDPVGAKANAALTALGMAICRLLGLSNPVGTGIAVLVIICFAEVGKRALCTMTTPDELDQYFG